MSHSLKRAAHPHNAFHPRPLHKSQKVVGCPYSCRGVPTLNIGTPDHFLRIVQRSRVERVVRLGCPLQTLKHHPGSVTWALVTARNPTCWSSKQLEQNRATFSTQNPKSDPFGGPRIYLLEWVPNSRHQGKKCLPRTLTKGFRGGFVLLLRLRPSI